MWYRQAVRKGSKPAREKEGYEKEGMLDKEEKLEKRRKNTQKEEGHPEQVEELRDLPPPQYEGEVYTELSPGEARAAKQNQRVRRSCAQKKEANEGG